MTRCGALLRFCAVGGRPGGGIASPLAGSSVSPLRGSARCFSAEGGKAGGDENPEEIEELGTFRALGGMGVAAFGAVALAAVGAVGAFQMASALAKQTGHSLQREDKPAK